MSKTAIVTDKAPKALGPYSAGVVSNGSINVSGQLGIDPATGKLAGDDIQSQTRQSLTNVKNILEAAGASMADVVRTTVLLADINEFGAMNEITPSSLRPRIPRVRRSRWLRSPVAARSRSRPSRGCRSGPFSSIAPQGGRCWLVLAPPVFLGVRDGRGRGK